MTMRLSIAGLAVVVAACGSGSSDPEIPTTGLPAWDGHQVVCGENVSFARTDTAELPVFEEDERLGFCARSMRYIALNREFGAQTSYFGVAAATVASLASTYAPLVRRSYSESTWAFMAQMSKDLEIRVNAAAARAENGTGLLSRFSGAGLDTKALIRAEQREIQTIFDAFAARDPEGYAQLIEEVNRSFNPTNPMLIAGIKRQPLYGAYEVGLAQIRARHGGAIDFSNIEQRIEIGEVLQALIEGAVL